MPFHDDDDDEAGCLLVKGHAGSTTPVWASEEGLSLLPCTDLTGGRGWSLCWEPHGSSAITWAKAKSSSSRARQGRTREGPGREQSSTGAATSPRDPQSSVPVPNAGAVMLLHSWCSCVTHTLLPSPVWGSGLDLSASHLNFNVQMVFTYKWPFLHPRHSRSSIA